MINDILKKLNISDLSKMQKSSIEAIENNDGDVVILSPTGSGKTLAYMLPLIEQIESENNDVQAVVIVPSRELAIQSADVLKSMHCGIRGMALYGGTPTMDEHRAIRKSLPQIIFATPGRLNDHIDKENIDVIGINYIIIDEFDKCLALGFSEEMKAAVNKLKAVQRRILLSATEEETIPQYVGMDNVHIINYKDSDSPVHKRITIYKVLSKDKDKLDALQRLLRSFGSESTIVFLGFRESVERTAEYLSSLGFTVSAYHGGMEQKVREEAIYKFANGSSNILVSTDLASRGLDIPDIENIVHYHLPENEEAYIHRTGRTARWDTEGRTFFILSEDEQMPPYIGETVEEYVIPTDLPKPTVPRMSTIYIGKGKKDKIRKSDVLGFLCRKGGLKGTEIGRIDVYDRYAYAAIAIEKLNSLLRNVTGEKIKGYKTIVEKAF